MNINKHNNEAVVMAEGCSNKDTGEQQHRPPRQRYTCMLSDQPVLTRLPLSLPRPRRVSELSCGVLVCGVKNRNRAMQGDVVVVEVLPKSEWRGKVTALAEGQGEERSGEENESKPVPTGETPPP